MLVSIAPIICFCWPASYQNLLTPKVTFLPASLRQGDPQILVVLFVYNIIMPLSSLPSPVLSSYMVITPRIVVLLSMLSIYG